MPKFSIALLAIIFYSIDLSAQSNFITLHEDCDFKGKQSILEPGNYSTYQMNIGNDKLSSIQIPSGMKVTIYEHKNYKGKSKTFTQNIPCLEAEWNDFASSVVVEGSNYNPRYNQNTYVTFYNDCYNKGYSKSLKAGSYKGDALGLLKNKISSFEIYGNLKVRVYLNNEDATGYNHTFNETTSCLSNMYNDKISSLVIEYDYNQGNNYNNGNNNGNYNNYGNSYVNIYSSCGYKGNSLRLAPGQYQGDKLGILKSAISSIEIPSNLQVKAYVSSDYLSGNYYTISENINCMTSTLKNNIRSLVIEEKNQSSNYNNNQNTLIDSKVTIYVDGNYKGQAVSLLPGTYSSMQQIGFPNKALSSLTVPEGFRVVLYENENFVGKKYTITQSKTGFSFSGWNDKTSSIAVYRDR
ncbi:MAG: hypothetical protein KA968_06005 [Chitinophagaceae bacterium]|nr:hypothetical protein [Chitinophagaceae bacterium]MBP7109113.1 hypothetical protein [Chitinophagaceae bacterium]MBP7314752.1 hypothetical protein [Chitinophagaceae bacterium]HQX96937.1 hypothetical protein [Chitinophagaceae bacterium]HRA10466.1 hypothetical protein [Chitinophagaceae bacterium]